MSFGNSNPFGGIDASTALISYTSMGPASEVTNGYLTSTDWNTFNNKQPTISLTVTGSSGASTFISNILNVPTYTLAGLGGIAKAGDTGIGNLTFIGGSILDSELTSGTDIFNIGTVNADVINIGRTGKIVNTLGILNVTGGTAVANGLVNVQMPVSISVGAGLSTGILTGNSIVQFGNNYQEDYTGIISQSLAGAMISIDTRNGSGATTYGGQSHTLFQIHTRTAGTTISEIPFQLCAAPTGSFIMNSDGLVSLNGGLTTPISITSTLANGTAPFTVASSTLVSNLNADTVDGYHASAFLQSVTVHDLLSSTHGDTLSDTVVRGDMIVANSTPKWARMAFPSTGYCNRCWVVNISLNDRC
jgi:hypothetical protein